jgi:hypothetical protein
VHGHDRVPGSDQYRHGSPRMRSRRCATRNRPPAALSAAGWMNPSPAGNVVPVAKTCRAL